MYTYYAPAGGETAGIPIPCPLCGSESHTVYRKIERARFVRCGNCSHVFQNPQPPFSDLKSRYQENYFQYELENEKNFFRLMVLGLEDIRFSDWEESLKTKGMFLDIGCATGMLLAHMKERGWKVQGVELCEPSARYGMEKRNVPIFIGTLEESTFSNESFSLIHASHLIEHLMDPVGFLRKLRQLLVPGGHAVLVTPNLSGFQAWLLGSRWRSCIPDHLHLFSRKTMESLVLREGFRVLHLQTWGGIAEGLAPPLVKRFMDRAAKRFGFGDVMLFHLSKI